jgi:uncharacterized RDD family membrane protein YckC
MESGIDQQMASETDTRSDNGNPPSTAGVWRRFAAGFYDLLLLTAVWILITLIFIMLRAGEAISPGALSYQLLLFVIAAAFHISSWLRGGQTLGMRAWRIRLEKSSGAAIDLHTGLLRFASGLLTIASGGVGLLWLWIDRDRLPWHDRLAGTRVIVLPAPRR